jgi:hypothetical protein
VRRLALVAALLLATCTVAPAPATTVSPSAAPSAESNGAGRFDAARAKTHVSYLADPARGGRMSGSAGYADAARYVADRFREIGLEPLGDDGTYFQHFPMPNVELAAMPVLQTTASPARTYKARVDMTESVGGRAGSGLAESTIAVVGGAARNGEQNDFAGVDARGKIALVTGPSQGGSVIEAAYAAGAAGVLLIGNTRVRYSYVPRFEQTTIPVLVITETVANELIAPSGRTVEAVRDAVRARRSDPSLPPTAFEAATTVRMEVSLTPVRQVDAINVVGVLRGADQAASQQAVLVGGHLDGIGTDPDGSVFLGANDNASGPAVTIEVARALTARRATLKRSVVFAAFAGEEEGFFGSDAYVAKTAASPGRVESLVAMLDLDVIGCCGESLFVSNEAPDLQRRIRETADRLGVSSVSAGSGGSDQTSFARRRVPAALIGWTEFILHTYRDTPDVVTVAKLKAAGDVVTEVTAQLASEG